MQTRRAKAEQDLLKLISNGSYRELQRVTNLQAMGVWDFYKHLYLVWAGVEPPVDLVGKMRQATMLAIRTPGRQTKRKPDVAAQTALHEALRSARQHLPTIEHVLTEWLEDGGLGRQPDLRMKWLNVVGPFTDALVALAKSHGVWLETSRAQGPGAVIWSRFTMMRAEEQAVEELREQDPETYTAINRYKKTAAAIRESMEQTVLSQGM
mgnify:CR=1 FL=1